MVAPGWVGRRSDQPRRLPDYGNRVAGERLDGDSVGRICNNCKSQADRHQKTPQRRNGKRGKTPGGDLLQRGNALLDSYGVPFVGGAYEIDDGTGKIWVLTERGTPSKGARVGVKGRVVNGPTFKGRNFGVAMRETDRRSR